MDTNDIDLDNALTKFSEGETRDQVCNQIGQRLWERLHEDADRPPPHFVLWDLDELIFAGLNRSEIDELNRHR